MKKQIKNLIKKSIASIGFEIKRKKGDDPLLRLSRSDHFFLEARELGFKPNLIFDIGANHGLWTAGMMKIFPDAKYVLFEPQPHCGPDIQKTMQESPRSIWRQAAVSNKLSMQSFKISNWDVTSRLLEVGEKDENSMEVEVTTVDNEAQREGRGPDLLKIDAEGSDLAVLEGAEKSLGKIEVILVEAGVLCQVENSIELVLERMRQYGYGLVGIVDLNPYHNPHGVMKTGRLWLVDLVFAYKGGELFKKFIAPPL